MKQFPPIPNVDATPDPLDEGHLWLLEQVDGAPLRFQLQRSGLVQFGDRDRVYDDPEIVPDPYQHAVRHIREHLDRDALRNAVDDVTDVVLFGKAMHHRTIEYDWERTPSFLGFDVWSAEQEQFRPPDAAEQIFERLGLHPVNTFEREVRARDFDPGSYAIPQSAWYDGPAAGVVVRNKQGGRAKLCHPKVQGNERSISVDEPVAEPADESPEDLATEYATRRRFEKLAAGLDERGQPVTFEALYERVLEDILREAYNRLYHDDATVDLSVFRSAVAARTREFLDERNGKQ